MKTDEAEIFHVLHGSVALLMRRRSERRARDYDQRHF